MWKVFTPTAFCSRMNYHTPLSICHNWRTEPISRQIRPINLTVNWLAWCCSFKQNFSRSLTPRWLGGNGGYNHSKRMGFGRLWTPLTLLEIDRISEFKFVFCTSTWKHSSYYRKPNIIGPTTCFLNCQYLSWWKNFRFFFFYYKCLYGVFKRLCTAIMTWVWLWKWKCSYDYYSNGFTRDSKSSQI